MVILYCLTGSYIIFALQQNALIESPVGAYDLYAIPLLTTMCVLSILFVFDWRSQGGVICQWAPCCRNRGSLSAIDDSLDHSITSHSIVSDASWKSSMGSISSTATPPLIVNVQVEHPAGGTVGAGIASAVTPHPIDTGISNRGSTTTGGIPATTLRAPLLESRSANPPDHESTLVGGTNYVGTRSRRSSFTGSPSRLLATTREQRESLVNMYIRGVLCMGIAFGLHLMEEFYCSQITVWILGHAWWHVLSAYATLTVFCVASYLRIYCHETPELVEAHVSWVRCCGGRVRVLPMVHWRWHQHAPVTK